MLGRTASELRSGRKQANSPPPDSEYIEDLLLGPRGDDSPFCQFQPIFTPDDTFIQAPLIETISLLSCVQTERAIELSSARSSAARTISFPVK